MIVKMAHEDLVGKNGMTEEAFWNLYFEYKYRDKFSSTRKHKKNILDTYEEKYMSGNFSKECCELLRL